MNTKLLLSIFLFSITIQLFSQEKKQLIRGKVQDSIGIVKNANIINLKTKQGTFSSDEGFYRIFVSKGDTLSFSSVQHLPKKIVITEKILDQNETNILLKSNIYTLDEFDLKRHNLMGRLGVDAKDVPKDVKDSLLRNVMDFSNINFKDVDNSIDEVERARPPVNNVDPTRRFVGAGAAISVPFQGSAKLWALRKELAQKKAFPYKILSELGEKFFFDDLKIPVDRYFHFLEYCNPLGIENLHKEGRQLEVIKILRAESEPYLKIIKE